MLCFVPLQCIPTQELSYQVRPNVILAQIQCLNCSPGENKSTRKACLPQQIVLPSKHLQHKDLLEVICEVLASKPPCTRSATFQLHGKHLFHLILSSSCIRGNSKWLFAAHFFYTAPQLPCYHSLQRGARRALIRGSLMTKLPYSFMTKSYDRVSDDKVVETTFSVAICHPLEVAEQQKDWCSPAVGLLPPPLPADRQGCQVLSPSPATYVIAGHHTQGSAFQTPHNKYLRDLKHAILENPVKQTCSYNYSFI